MVKEPQDLDIFVEATMIKIYGFDDLGERGSVLWWTGEYPYYLEHARGGEELREIFGRWTDIPCLSADLRAAIQLIQSGAASVDEAMTLLEAA